MTAIGLLVIGAGVVLIYSGVKGEDPRDVLKETLTGRRSDRSTGGISRRPTSAPLQNISPVTRPGM